MGKDLTGVEHLIRAEMSVLDVLSRYRHAEDVFRKYDERAGECICCNALFESLNDLAARYGLDLDTLLKELEEQAKAGK